MREWATGAKFKGRSGHRRQEIDQKIFAKVVLNLNKNTVRILFHFPALKIVKQNEEMKQNAVGWNNWKKSGIFFHLFQFSLHL